MVYILSELNIINFKYFFATAAILTLLISIDVIIQYTFGYNIVGLESYVHHNTSFFTDELISGGYIQNFSFFSILYLVSFLTKNNNFLITALIILATCVLGAGILLSGNRMPLALFILGLILIYIFNKKIRNKISVSFLFLIIVLGSIISFDDYYKQSYRSFYDNVHGVSTGLFTRMITDKETTLKEEQKKFKIYVDEKGNFKYPESGGHTKIFSTGIETWKLHKIFGNGIKSFRQDCKKIIEKQRRGMCSNHPHNYFLEVLTDLGLVGFTFVILIASLFIFFLIKNYKFFNSIRLENLFLFAAMISLFLEVFPFKSSGSVFSTNNTTYIILMSAIVLVHKKILENKNS